MIVSEQLYSNDDTRSRSLGEQSSGGERNEGGGGLACQNVRRPGNNRCVYPICKIPAGPEAINSSTAAAHLFSRKMMPPYNDEQRVMMSLELCCLY